MITDEQIKYMTLVLLDCETLPCANFTVDFKTEKYLMFSEWKEQVKKVVALAQEVKPLQWCRCGIRWSATTDFGVYFLEETEFDYKVKLVETPMGATEMIAHRINGMDNAKEAANEDYQRRVLQCLVHGGG